MTESSAPPQIDTSLRPALGASIVFHILLFILLAVRAFFLPSEPLQIEQAIKVDIVALPDHSVTKLPPAPVPAPEEPAKPLPKPVDQPRPVPAPAKPAPVLPKVEPKVDPNKINLHKTKHDEQAALRRLEALDRLQKQPEPNKPTKTEAAEPTAPPIKGNEISRGGALKGIVRLENEQYAQTIHDHVTRHWNLPQFLASANLSALVRVFVDAQGNVVKKVLVKSSNNPVFDQSAMQAVEASTPLPHPPSDLASLVSVRGIDINFTPEH